MTPQTRHRCACVLAATALALFYISWATLASLKLYRTVKGH